MSVASGKIRYEVEGTLVTGCGFSYTDDELDTALSGVVADIVFDTAGKAEIRALLEGLAATDFEMDAIERILTDVIPPEDWRVGEALAESYLAQHRNCFFPWPDGRDERKAGSSLPGADLVGFQTIGDEISFVFGEVKTSAQLKYPPDLVYGRGGLQRQLEDLKLDDGIRNSLVKYLAYRATNSKWRDLYRRAAKRYIRSSTSIRVYGFLVRDVDPHKKDLSKRVEVLSQSPYPDMLIELLAVYLPTDRIKSLSKTVSDVRTRGAA